MAGETGSGKTTQLPKMCLELGRGVVGRIGHTQPRRIAARSVAARIAEELGTPLGSTVGFAVRFADRVGPDTAIKVMTDGILLAEIQRDPMLREYDTVIVDEAHERSLNIDFILGYLRTLLPRRPDLKLIVTSATIDYERFAEHFAGAPVIEVSGRMYPVEVRYRPLQADSAPDDAADAATDAAKDTKRAPVVEPRDQTDAIVDAVGELGAEGSGDILVFLSGEREIRDTADVLRGLQLRDTEILPLYARLSTAEQHRVFAAHTGRRIVLSTNVAETSLTVPGIRYVIDTGLARISRYSHRTKVQRLPIEAISQASARQRSGRCGRQSDGICIRLYSQADFDARPEFTDPEILRTSLASVILQMASLRLGDVAAFGFLDPPDRRSVRDGRALLYELGAFDADEPDPDRAVTPLGRRLARLPVDPRLGRMLLAADEQGCLSEVVVIAAALSIQDPRERPVEHEQAAAALHARFADEHSDFVSYLNLSRYLAEQQQELTGNQFRRLCRAEYLNYLRIREWQDLVAQLRRIARTIGLAANREPATPGAVHAALLSGLLSQVGAREGERREYRGARNSRFVLAGGSAVAKKPPRWVMAAELVETSRLYARTVARTDPEAIERAAGHLVQRTYSEPRWEPRRGAAVATERVTLYGLPLVTGRTVAYGAIDPVEARELFIQHALVEGEWTTRHRFVADNRQLLDEARELEQRARRNDMVVTDVDIADFFRQRIPADVVSARHFDSWWKRRRARQPDLLTFPREFVLRHDRAGDDAFPDSWSVDGVDLAASYRFAPGSDDDGVTLHIPLAVLNRIDPDAVLAPVGGQRRELITALLRSLPKHIRRDLGPAPDRAAALDSALGTERTALLPALERQIRADTGVIVTREDWQLDQVPSHLRPRFVVEDDDHRALASGRDLHALRQEQAAPVREVLADAVGQLERANLRAWDFGPLPRSVRATYNGAEVVGYPSLVDEAGTVAVRVLASAGEQQVAMRAGTVRLLRLTAPSPVRAVLGPLDARARLALGVNPDGTPIDLAEDCADAVTADLVDANSGVAWDADGFARLVEAVRAGLVPGVAAALRDVRAVLDADRELDDYLAGAVATRLGPAADDLRRQREALLYKGFVAGAGRRRLPDLARYLQAMTARAERLPREAEVDAVKADRVHLVEQAYAQVRTRLPDGVPEPPELADVRWMIEELRVSLFAQRLRTAYPISEQRIYRVLDGVEI